MTPAEITKELDELEGRLERLRIKYDQYFMGFERMLPFVARKDVDRRFQTLHREQMRNTGIRFRFNTLVSRFTTYQTHWGRILRQIEEGTWVRDLKRMQRLGLKPPIDRKKRKPGSNEPEEISANQLEEVEDSGAMLGSRGDREEIPESLFGAWQSTPSHHREEMPENMDFHPMEPEPVEPSGPAERPIIPVPTTTSSPSITVNTPVPATRPRPALSPFGAMRAPSPARGVEAPEQGPSVQVNAARVQTMAQPAAPAVVTGESPPPEAPAPARLVPPPPGVVLPPPGVEIPPRPATSTQPIAGIGVRGQPLRPNTRTTTGSHPTAGAVSSPAPVARTPAASVVIPAPAPVQREAGGDASIRKLHESFVEARRKTGENTAVPMETIAKQVRETLPRLQEKYPGAEVKLEVAVNKDGKTILRPVVTVKKK